MNTQFKIVGILCTFYLFAVPANSVAQLSSFQWAEQIGGSALDESFSVAVDIDGYCYVTGIFNETVTIADTTLVSRGKTDIFLVKYAPDGQLTWIKQIGGKEDDDGYAVYIDDYGHCYLTGSFSDTAYFDNDSLICFDSNIFYFDIFLAKFTLDGDLLWVKRAGEQYWDEAFGMCTDATGKIFITGSYWGTAKFDNITITGLYGMGATDGFDIFIAKYDTEGNALWANRMVERGWDRGSDVVADNYGNCYVTGGFQTALLFGNFGGPSLTATGGSGDEDIFLVKYDSSGNFVWKTSAGGTGFDQARAITVDAENNIYVTGIISDTAAFDDTTEVISFGDFDMFIAKYDSSGQLIWAAGAGSEGEDGANDVTVDAMGNVFVCGYFGGPALFDDINIIGGGLFITKYNANGQAQWVKQVAEVTNLSKSLVLDPDGNLYVAGVFENDATFGTTTLSAHGQADVFLTLLDTVAVAGLASKPSPYPGDYHLAQNYPNPFNPVTRISFTIPSFERVKIRIFTILGQHIATLIDKKIPSGNHEIGFDARGLPSGVYFYQIEAGDFSQVRKMIVLK